MIRKFNQYLARLHVNRHERNAARNFLHGEAVSGNPEQARIHKELQILWSDLDLLKENDFPERIKARAAWDKAPYRRATWQTFVRTCAIASLLIAIALIWHIDPFPNHETNYETFNGKPARLSLRDDSVVHLNAMGMINVRFYRSRREITLETGEAFFEVQHMHDKPFIVAIDDIHVRAIGTAFNISKKTNRIEVAVAEGVVEILAPSKPEKLRLEKGEFLQYSGNEETSLSRIDPEKIANWRHPRTAFDKTSLKEILSTLKSHGLNKRVSINKDASELKLTGSFRIQDPIAFLKMLPDVLPIRIEEQRDHILITTDP